MVQLQTLDPCKQMFDFKSIFPFNKSKFSARGGLNLSTLLSSNMADPESCFCKLRALGRCRLLSLTIPAEAAVGGCSMKGLQQRGQGAMEKVNDQIEESHS